MTLQIVQSPAYSDLPRATNKWCPIDARVSILAGIVGGSGLIQGNPSRGTTIDGNDGTNVPPDFPVGTALGPTSARLAQATAPTEWDYGGAAEPGHFGMTFVSSTQLLLAPGRLVCRQRTGTQPWGAYLVWNDADLLYTLTTVGSGTNEQLIALCVGVKDRDVTGVPTTVTIFEVAGAAANGMPDIEAASNTAGYTHVGLIGFAHIFGTQMMIYPKDLYPEEAFGGGDITFKPVYIGVEVLTTTTRSVTQNVWSNANTIWTLEINGAATLSIRPRRDVWARVDAYIPLDNATVVHLPRLTSGTAEIQKIEIWASGSQGSGTTKRAHSRSSVIALLAGGVQYDYAPFVTTAVTVNAALYDMGTAAAWGTRFPSSQFMMMAYPLATAADFTFA